MIYFPNQKQAFVSTTIQLGKIEALMKDLQPQQKKFQKPISMNNPIGVKNNGFGMKNYGISNTC